MLTVLSSQDNSHVAINTWQPEHASNKPMRCWLLVSLACWLSIS